MFSESQGSAPPRETRFSPRDDTTLTWKSAPSTERSGARLPSHRAANADAGSATGSGP